MDAKNKRSLYICIALSCLLAVLIYARARYFDYDFRITYESGDLLISDELYPYTADTSLYSFSSYEGKMLASTPFFAPQFLPNFPYEIGDWRGKDITHPYADINLFRLYHRPKTDDYLWLIVVYGGHQSKFHAAEVCYIIDGWQVEHRLIQKIKIREHAFPIRRMTARKGKNRHLVGYWYLWPTPHRRITEGTLLFRISVEAAKSEKKAEKAFLNFVEGLASLKRSPEITPPRLAKAKIQPRTTKEPPAEPSAEPSAEPPAIAVQTPGSLQQAKRDAMKWIVNQRVPNEVVPFPHFSRRYMLLSYELNRRQPKTENDKAYPYIFSRSAIYDNAIGLIALSMAGRDEEAESLMDAFGRIIQKSGELWFSYNTHNDWPSEWSHDEALIRNGANSWAGYAVTYHIRRKLLDDPDFLKTHKHYQHYLKLAQRIADAILKDQVTDSKDPRYGAVTGGQGAFEMVARPADNRVIEKFQKGKVQWASIEHNLDLYFLLKNLWILTKEKKYQIAMAAVKTALSNAWNETEGQFNRGLRLDGRDTAMALDCASWGLLFARSIGDDQKIKPLLAAMENYAVTDTLQKIRGYRPYYKGLVYDEPDINKLIYPHRPQKSWSDIPIVWSEGSLGVAMAYLKAGQKDKVRAILDNIIKMQTPSGGISYATQEVPFQFSPSPSMAGTAWLAMVLHALDDPRLLDLFWD